MLLIDERRSNCGRAVADLLLHCVNENLPPGMLDVITATRQLT
jgi:hypothetical protein